MNTSLEELTSDLNNIAAELLEKRVLEKIKDHPEKRELFNDWREYYRSARRFPDDPKAVKLAEESLHRLLNS